MVRCCLYLLFVFLCSITLFAQEKVDTIHSYNKTIVGKVREVGDEILYTHPNEDVVYRIKKRQVLSIVFSSGRKEVFNTTSNYLPVKKYTDWKNVSITYIPEETEDMIRLGIISTKASGLTVYSSVTKTQNRAFQRLQKTAAMMGGNVVLINNQAVEGNISGQRTTRTQLTSTIYRTAPFDTTGIFRNLIGKNFQIVEKNIMKPTHTEPTTQKLLDQPSMVTMLSRELISFRNGIPYINLTVRGEVREFVITYHGESGFIAANLHNSLVSEIKLKRVR